jgi:hypothetical protein
VVLNRWFAGIHMRKPSDQWVPGQNRVTTHVEIQSASMPSNGSFSAQRRFNPKIRGFADRLERAGKPFKVVLTACMRKLLTILNAIVRQGAPWQFTSNQMQINTDAGYSLPRRRRCRRGVTGRSARSSDTAQSL